MESAVKKFGNSSGVVIPKPLLSEIGAKAGDQIDITVQDGRIIIELIGKKHPREGWAEASKRIAAAGDDALIWPDFANDDDDAEWTW